MEIGKGISRSDFFWRGAQKDHYIYSHLSLGEGDFQGGIQHTSNTVALYGAKHSGSLGDYHTTPRVAHCIFPPGTLKRTHGCTPGLLEDALDAGGGQALALGQHRDLGQCQTGTTLGAAAGDHLATILGRHTIEKSVLITTLDLLELALHGMGTKG